MTRHNLSLRSSHLICLIVLVGAMGTILAQETQKPASPDPLEISAKDRLKIFENLWELVNREYFDPQFGEVNWVQLKEEYRPRVEAAINKTELREVLQRMVTELNSSHLRVSVRAKLEPERIKKDIPRKLARNERFRFDTGLRLTLVEGQHVVDSVVEGSGAQLAGVMRGWILTHWNGASYAGSLTSGCDLGEKVELRFNDLQWQGHERNLEVVCKLYAISQSKQERIVRILDEGALYVRFTEFATGTNDWLVHQLVQNHTVPAVIIDLRGNSGGLLSVLRECLEPLFSEHEVFGEFRERNGKEPNVRVSGRGKSAYGGRVMVLIDEGSASAAEIFAAGIQDSGRGIVIGRQSRGAVLASKSYGLPNGFSVTIPIRDYRTAKGMRLEGRGVIPDTPVNLTMQDFVENRDPDLGVARGLLRKRHH